MLVGYQDEVPAVNAVVKILTGEMTPKGTLPVSTNKFKCGDGIRDLDSHPDTPLLVLDESLDESLEPIENVSVFALPAGEMKKAYEHRLDSVAR